MALFQNVVCLEHRQSVCLPSLMLSMLSADSFSAFVFAGPDLFAGPGTFWL